MRNVRVNESTTNLVIGGFDIGTLIPGNPIFTGRFIPSDPIIPGNPVTPISFSFSGHSGGPAIPAFAFPGTVDLATLVEPAGAPTIPLDSFIPGEPVRQSDQIVAFDDPEVVGAWDIVIQAALCREHCRCLQRALPD